MNHLSLVEKRPAPATSLECEPESPGLLHRLILFSLAGICYLAASSGSVDPQFSADTDSPADTDLFIVKLSPI